MTRLVRYTPSLDQFTDDPCPLCTVVKKIKYRCFLSLLNDNPPWPWNILQVTRGVLCSSFNWDSIFFNSQENCTWQPKVFFFIPVTRNILSFKGKILLWQILYSFCHRRFSVSCDMGLFHHVPGNFPPFTRCTVCVTWRIFSITGMIFHLSSSQEIFFLWDKEDLLLLFQWILIICVTTVFFLSRELFFLWERIVFFIKFGSF